MSAFLRRAALPLLLLAVAAAPASAGVIEFNGVTFTSSTSGNVLTLEIDAAARKNGWSDARYLDAIGIKTSGSYATAAMSSSTGAKWQLGTAELTAKGCQAGNGNKATSFDKLCFGGLPVALGDNMVFTFTFDGAASPDAAHLKVRFLDSSFSKIDELMSKDFVTSIANPKPETSLEQRETGAGDPAGGTQPTDIPEPQTLALVAGGLAALGLLRRRKPRA